MVTQLCQLNTLNCQSLHVHMACRTRWSSPSGMLGVAQPQLGLSRSTAQQWMQQARAGPLAALLRLCRQAAAQENTCTAQQTCLPAQASTSKRQHLHTLASLSTLDTSRNEVSQHIFGQIMLLEPPSIQCQVYIAKLQCQSAC